MFKFRVFYLFAENDEHKVQPWHKYVWHLTCVKISAINSVNWYCVNPTLPNKEAALDLLSNMANNDWIYQLRSLQLVIILCVSIAFFLLQLFLSHISHALTLLVNAYHMLCNIIALTGCIITLKVSPNELFKRKNKFQKFIYLAKIFLKCRWMVRDIWMMMQPSEAIRVACTQVA